MHEDDDLEAGVYRRVQAFFAMIPHGERLGIRLGEVGPWRASAVLPYRAELVGDPDTGVLHGGAVTTLVDQTSGGAAVAALPRPQPIVTLDLRIDYLGAARAGVDIVARAECYRLAREIAFVRCTVEQAGDGAQVAESMSTFIRVAGDVSVVPGSVP